MTREEAIRWLVQLANTDVDTLSHGRPGDLLNLLHDLRRFVGIVAPGPIEDEIRLAEKDPTVLKPASEVARRLVNAAVTGNPASFRGTGGWEVTLNAGGQRGYSHLAMPLEDAVFHSAYHDYDIDRDDIGDRIKRCKECSRVFAASRKDAIYCGRECANNTAVRAYRQRQAKATTRLTERAEPKTRAKREKGDG